MNEVSKSFSDSRFARFGLGLLLAAAALFVYRQTLDYELLTWDDDQHITTNRYYHPITFWNLLHFLGYAHLHLYIPVSYWFYAFEVWLCRFFPSDNPEFTYNPAVFHAGNVVVHLACTLLAYRLIRKLTCHAPAAFVGGLLFALHPLQVESACWVGESRGTLATFFSLLATWYYLKYSGVDPERGIFAAQRYEPPVRRRRDYWYALAAFAAALLSKPSAASLPLIVLLVDVVLLRRTESLGPAATESPRRRFSSLGIAKRLWNPSVRRLTLWFIGAAIITGLTKHYQKNDMMYGPAVAPWLDRPFVAGDAYAFYLVKLVWPFDMAFDYGRTPHYVKELPTFYWAWLLPVLVAAALALCPRRRIWLGCYSIFLAAVAPVSGAVPFLYQSISTVADRYMYVPMFGFGLMAAAWIASRPRPEWAMAAALFVMGLFSFRAYDQCKYWRSDWTLYTQGIDVTPRSFMAHLSLGHRYRNNGDHQQAIDHYRAVLRIRPDYTWANYYGGLSLAQLNRYDEAIAEYREGLQYSGDWMDLHVALGDALAQTGDDAAAEAEYRVAANLAPDDQRPHVIYGEFLYRRKRFDEGAREFDEARRLRPEDAEVAQRYGRAVLESEGDEPTRERRLQAVGILQEAVRLDPNSAQTHADLAKCYAWLYDQSPTEIDYANRAIKHGREALRLDPNNAGAHYYLGITLRDAGQIVAAIYELEQAEKLVAPGASQAALIRSALAELQQRAGE